jgi:hypothetical protein
MLISQIHDKAGRDISEEVSLDCIPGAANFLLGASSSNVATTSDTTLAPFQTGKRDGAEVGVDNAVEAKKTRTDAVQSNFWQTAPLKLVGNTFSFAHLSYDIWKIYADALRCISRLLRKRNAPT